MPKTSNLLDDAWANERNRKITSGENPSDGSSPKPPPQGMQQDTSWRREIEQMWALIEGMKGPIAHSMDKALYEQTWINVHRAYFYVLTAERNRLLYDVLKGVDPGIGA